MNIVSALAGAALLIHRFVNIQIGKSMPYNNRFLVIYALLALSGFALFITGLFVNKNKHRLQSIDIGLIAFLLVVLAFIDQSNDEDLSAYIICILGLATMIRLGSLSMIFTIIFAGVSVSIGMVLFLPRERMLPAILQLVIYTVVSTFVGRII
ncbi:hypothetical protein MASR2M48_34470 [Spirochaetota bacterium]